MPDQKSLLLIIEDEHPIRRFLRNSLEAEGLEVIEAETGRAGLDEVSAQSPQLLILDLGLPDMDGTEVIRQCRAISQIPIIVLSARTQEREKVAALDAGADDYLTKPFGTPELMARIRAHLRRQKPSVLSGVETYRFGQISVDVIKRYVRRENEDLHLTPHEYKLLLALLRNAGKVLTHLQLLRDVWGTSYGDNEHYVRIYMAHLRRKIEKDSANPEFLLTETGVGYRLIGVTGGL